MVTTDALATIAPTTPVKWQADSLTVGPVNHLAWSDVSHHWWPYDPYPQRYVYPTAVITSPARNRTEVAFNIVTKMIEKGLVQELTVAQFIDLVNDVAQIV